MMPAPPALQAHAEIRKQQSKLDASAPLKVSAPPAAALCQKIALRLLVVNATAQDPALAGAKNLLDQSGVPYEVLTTATSDLSSQQLRQ